MTTEQLRHRMPPILKALKERSLRGRTPVEGLRRTECAYHGWDTVHADAASWEPFASFWPMWTAGWYAGWT